LFVSPAARVGALVHQFGNVRNIKILVGLEVETLLNFG
jgi:hypothetical protein